MAPEGPARIYDLIETLYDHNGTKVVRAIMKGTGRKVVLKRISVDPLSGKSIRAEHEYLIMKDIAGTGVIGVLDYFEDETARNIVMDDVGGIALEDHIAGKTIPITDAIRFAAGIASSLVQIHSRGVAHLAVNPGNIIINPETGMIWLIDFGSAIYTRGQTAVTDLTTDAGSILSYISPEQTGRINRNPDSRSDLYSLGIVLFRMITGAFPYSADNPLDIVHAHIAQSPLQPEREGVPTHPALRMIISKLLAKNPDERYQSAYGVMTDLMQTEEMIVEGNTTGEGFIPGRDDYYDGFRLPRRIFGRSSEIETIKRAAARVHESGLPELILVTGESGTGKSTLVREALHVDPASNGYIASGKFDQNQTTLPYYALRQAFDELASRLLAESDNILQSERRKIIAATEPNCRVIIDFAPKWGLALGPQPALRPLPPVETHNRFGFTLQKFFSTLSNVTHPVIVFIDDVHWADAVSTELIASILTNPDTRYTLFVCAYRNSETREDHPFIHAVRQIERFGVPINMIRLDNLSREYAGEFIADSFPGISPEKDDLIGHVISCTRGNPFFLSQYLRSLYEERAIRFDHASRRWVWVPGTSVGKPSFDDEMSFIGHKFERFDPALLHTLRAAACIGDRFSVEILAKAIDLSEENTASLLRIAEETGLVTFESSDMTKSNRTGTGPSAKSCGFIHDRVKHRIYDSIPEEVRAKIHRAIVRVHLEKTVQLSDDESLFDIAGHILQCVSLISNPHETRITHDILTRAARKARTASAYSAALEYMTAALLFIQPDAWIHEYRETLDFHTDLAEIQFLNARYADAEKTFALIVSRARTPLDKVSAYEVKILNSIANGKYHDAVRFGIAAFRDLGIRIPRKPSGIRLAAMILRTRLRLRGRKPEFLENLHPMTDPLANAATRILYRMLPAASFTEQKMYVFLLIKMLRLTLDRGYTKYSPISFLSYGLLLHSVFKNHALGYDFGKMAVKIVDERSVDELRCFITLVFSVNIAHCRDFIGDLRPALESGFIAGIRWGDTGFAAYCVNIITTFELWRGNPLGVVNDLLASQYNRIFSLQHQDAIDYFLLTRQFVRNLSGNASDTTVLSGEGFDESVVTRWLESNSLQMVFLFYLYKSILYFLNDDLDRSAEMIGVCAEYTDSAIGRFEIPLFGMITSLVIIERTFTTGTRPSRRNMKLIRANIRTLKRYAESCPANYCFMHLLVSASYERLRGNVLKASDMYERSVDAARSSGFNHFAAIAGECAARFHFAAGTATAGKAYCAEAVSGYRRWGCFRAGILIAKYGINDAAVSEERILRHVDTESLSMLDITTVLYASHALTQEIELDKLIQRLLELVIENSGAQKGVLLLNQGNVLLLHAIAETAPDQIRVQMIQNMPFHTIAARDDCPVPASVIQYVQRTMESVLMSDARNDPAAENSSYIEKNGVASLLCVPLVYQRKLTGILYLENNLVTGVFTTDRYQLLTMLASQAAISIEIARFIEKTRYAEMDIHRQFEEIQSQYEEMEAMNEELQRTYRDLLDANESLAVYKQFFETSNQGMAMTDPKGKILFLNQALCRMLGGIDPAIAAKTPLAEYYSPKTRITFEDTVFPAILRGEEWIGEVTLTTRPDRKVHTIHVLFPIRNNNQTVNIALMVTDITDQKKLEEQFLQSQKMEAIGRLAGGIAHDFNNFLTAIIGYSDLTMQEISPSDKHYAYITEIQNAAQRSAALTNQLLAFSRKQMLNKQYVDINRVILGMKAMLVRLIGENISLETSLDDKLDPAFVDKGQIEQVIMNLVVNAHDAMPDGGTITIITSNRVISELEARDLPDTRAGQFICLSICDSGTGIPENHISKIFEPFFSTKEMEKGTGLGLSVVYGIITQHNGWISVNSEQSRGSSFNIFLPVAEHDQADSIHENTDADIPPGKGERILIVEDQHDVLGLASRALRRHGYTVFEASSGSEAERLFGKEEGKFDLLFCDVVLPDMNGPAIVDKLFGDRTDIRVILTSGYPDKTAQWETIKNRGYAFLQKPYDLHSLLRMVRNCLDRDSRPLS